MPKEKNIKIMKNLTKLTVLAFAAISFTFASCDSKPAENAEEATENTVDAAQAELDSVGMATEGDTAVVRDQPVQDGVTDKAKAQ
jgi:hypothetical protein